MHRPLVQSVLKAAFMSGGRARRRFAPQRSLERAERLPFRGKEEVKSHALGIDFRGGQKGNDRLDVLSGKRKWVVRSNLL